MRKTLFILLFLSLLGLIFLPTLLSTSPGTWILFQFIKPSVRSTDATFSWFGPQVLKNTQIETDEYSLWISYFKTDVPLYRIKDFRSSFEIENGTFTLLENQNLQIRNFSVKKQDTNLKIVGKTSEQGSLWLEGQFNHKNDFAFQANLQKIPTALLNVITDKGSLIVDILGSETSFVGNFKLKNQTGFLKGDLASSFVKLKIDSKVQENLLTLNENLSLSLKLSPKLEELLLKNVSPKLFSKIHFQDAILFYLFKQDFHAKLSPFSLENLQIGNAITDFGKIKVKSGKSLHSLLQFFKTKDTPKWIDIWTTSFSFSFFDEILSLGRMDSLLANSIHVCTWGDIDLKTDKLHMFLGVPAPTLKGIFSLSRLPDSYTLSIPIKGTIQDPDFDTGPAAAKIAALIAAPHLPTKPGKVFGGAIKAILQLENSDEIPPPKRPFPWE